jgi:hypothetical protein
MTIVQVSPVAQTETAAASQIRSPHSARSHRFHLLDGLRGFAAILVVLYHMPPYLQRWFACPNAFLAVDFFFCLSGFIIAYSYEDRILRGMSFRDFCSSRLIRLYPLYFLGSLFGLISVCILAYGTGSCARTPGAAEPGKRLEQSQCLPAQWAGVVIVLRTLRESDLLDRDPVPLGQQVGTVANYDHLLRHTFGLHQSHLGCWGIYAKLSFGVCACWLLFRYGPYYIQGLQEPAAFFSDGKLCSWRRIRGDCAARWDASNARKNCRAACDTALPDSCCVSAGSVYRVPGQSACSSRTRLQFFW